MFLIPFRNFNLSRGKCKPVIHTGKTLSYLLTGFHSCLIVYNIKNFKLKSASPFLHPCFSIFQISPIKERIFVCIGSCLYILDFFVPTTRFSNFSYPISYLVSKKSFIFCLSSQEKVAILINPWTFKIFARIFFPEDTTVVELSNKDSKENFMYVSTVKGNIEVWDLNFFCHTFSVYLAPLQFVKLLKPNFNTKTIAIKTNQEKMLVLNLKNKAFSFFLENEEVKNFKEILLFSFWKKTLFFSNNRFLFSWNIKKKTIFKTNFLIHTGEIFIGGFIGLKNYFLTIGKKDNTVALHHFVKQGGYFKLIKFHCGNFYPSFKLKSFRNIKGVIVFPDSRSLFRVANNLNQDTEKLRQKEWIRSKFFLNRKNEKLIIKQLIMKRNIFDSDQLTAIFCFYHSKNPWVWKINQKIISQLFVKLNLVQEIKGLLSCMTVSPKTNCILVCFTSGFLFYVEIESGYLLKKIHNHCFSKAENFSCKISGCDFNETGDFVITGCFHGILKLWDANLSPKKSLEIGKPIHQIHWYIKADLIIVSCVDYIIRLIYPEDFLISKIFTGHVGIINDFLFLGNSKFLITASMDLTIKLWQISNERCKDTSVCSFAPISLALDKKESILFTSHRNTIGIGLWKFSKYLSPKDKFFSSTFTYKSFQRSEETTSIPFTYKKNIFNRINRHRTILFKEKIQYSPLNEENIRKNDFFIKNCEIFLKNLQNKEKNEKRLNFFQKLLSDTYLSFSKTNITTNPPIKLSKSFSESNQKKNFSKKDIFLIISYFAEECVETLMEDYQIIENTTKISLSVQNLNLQFLGKNEKSNLIERFLTETTRVEIIFRVFFKKCNFFSMD